MIRLGFILLATLLLPSSAQSAEAKYDPVESYEARRIEGLGYSTLLIPDHFGDQLAPMPAMMAAAAATTTLRVGGLVLDNDYKHPLVHAKEAATIDVLSGRRMEFGLGAGWMRTDYDAAGMV